MMPRPTYGRSQWPHNGVVCIGYDGRGDLINHHLLVRREGSIYANKWIGPRACQAIGLFDLAALPLAGSSDYQYATENCRWHILVEHTLYDLCIQRKELSGCWGQSAVFFGELTLAELRAIQEWCAWATIEAVH